MFVEIETKSEELLLINSDQISFIRVGLDSKGLPSAIVFFGEEIIEQGSSNTAHVQWTGGTGGKTNANRC